MRRCTRLAGLSPIALFVVLFLSNERANAAGAIDRPNVPFIAVDDLNDWVGCPGGHAQAKTPNIDGLAKKGVLFEQAYCADASSGEAGEKRPEKKVEATAKAPVRTASDPARRKRPNVVVLLADDLGSKDIGCDGGPVKTPTLDKLAANGVLRVMSPQGRACTRFARYHTSAAATALAAASSLWDDTRGRRRRGPPDRKLF